MRRYATVLLTVLKLCDTANTVMQLGILKIESTKPKDKPQKLADGNGLYLYISPAPKPKESGTSKTPRQVTRSWRYDFRFANKRYTLILQVYNESQRQFAVVSVGTNDFEIGQERDRESVLHGH